MLGDIVQKTRASRPLVHCVTNYVTANDCANLLLAVGASAIMADDLDEVEEVTAMCDSLVLNMGTPNPRRLQAMLLAGQTANRLYHSVVLDPVGVGSSKMRMDAAHLLLEKVHFSVIRGNISEMETLLDGMGAARRGVDMDPRDDLCDRVALARAVAQIYGTVAVVTGDVDVVTDGHIAYQVRNGHIMMRSVTGTGCQLSALIGAYVAAHGEDVLRAALAATCAMGLSGEIAHERLREGEGNASFRNYIIDAMFCLTPEALERGAKYELVEGVSAPVRGDGSKLAKRPDAERTGE